VLTLLKAAIFLVSVLALIVVGWGTYNQIKGQAETNKEMKRVALSVKKANELTGVTVQRLSPLSETAATLRTMNSGLTKTGSLLTEMNAGIGSVANSERTIIKNLTALNQTTSGVLDQLKNVSAGSGNLVSGTGKMGSQVQQEANSMGGLNGLTDESIAQLRKLNQKFSLLRALP
jgi:hypothetical protein